MSRYPTFTETLSGDPVTIIANAKGFYVGYVETDGKHLLYFWDVQGRVRAKNLAHAGSKITSQYNLKDGAAL